MSAKCMKCTFEVKLFVHFMRCHVMHICGL